MSATPASVSQPEEIIYIDGKFYPKSEAKVSVFDHGLLYGDGIFEGLRFYKRNIFRLSEHLDPAFTCWVEELGEGEGVGDLLEHADLEGVHAVDDLEGLVAVEEGALDVVDLSLIHI